MSRRSIRKECFKLGSVVDKFDTRDEDDVLPPCNGIDRIIFQARFINRSRKTDPEVLAPIIEAAKKSLQANLVCRPWLSSHKAVVSALR